MSLSGIVASFYINIQKALAIIKNDLNSYLFLEQTKNIMINILIWNVVYIYICELNEKINAKNLHQVCKCCFTMRLTSVIHFIYPVNGPETVFAHTSTAICSSGQLGTTSSFMGKWQVEPEPIYHHTPLEKTVLEKSIKQNRIQWLSFYWKCTGYILNLFFLDINQCSSLVT